ncbi:hypothetical protein [Streptomyces sp. NPDC002952]|uniref:hypothetical protein n=1 Tax=Streptomyces sp. NPDC002952 TaxID=3364673 RepID=UPI0036B9D057
MRHIQKVAASAVAAGVITLSMTLYSASAARASTGWYDILVQFDYLTSVISTTATFAKSTGAMSSNPTAAFP